MIKFTRVASGGVWKKQIELEQVALTNQDFQTSLTQLRKDSDENVVVLQKPFGIPGFFKDSLGHFQDKVAGHVKVDLVRALPETIGG